VSYAYIDIEERLGRLNTFADQHGELPLHQQDVTLAQRKDQIVACLMAPAGRSGLLNAAAHLVAAIEALDAAEAMRVDAGDELAA
jgi:hypothetical protein